MSKFRIGQLCVFARSRFGFSGYVGEVVEVTDIGSVLAGVCTRPAICDVKILHRKSGTHGWCQSWQLEPLINDGAAPSELTYTELMDRLKAGEVECV